MPKTHATLLDDIQSELQDDGTDFTDAVLTIVMDKALIEMSEYQPYITRETFQIESRTGSATSTTSNKLVDATNAQFVSGDVDKVIYNTTDNTWAIVTAQDSTTTLSISKDIMASGEKYEIFNEGCKSNKQIYIGDMPDYLEILGVTYRTQQFPEDKRNWTVQGDILTLDIDFEPDDSGDSTNDIDVYVYFAKSHRVCRQAGLSGALTSDYAVGVTSMAMDGLTTADGYVYEGVLFTVAGVRGTYTVSADAAITGGTATVSFWPALIDATTDGDAVTFIGSTLSPRLERILVDLTAARAVIGKGVDYIGQVNVGGMRTWTDFLEWGEHKLSLVLSELRRITPPQTRRVYPKE